MSLKITNYLKKGWEKDYKNDHNTIFGPNHEPNEGYNTGYREFFSMYHCYKTHVILLTSTKSKILSDAVLMAQNG